MKDAKGHGSNAHEAGVNAIGTLGVGKEPYQWEKQADGVHRLVSPGFQPIASVSPAKMRTDVTPTAPKGYVVAQLHKDFNTGQGHSGNWGLLGTVQAGKKWAESKMANSWHPPTIKK